MRSPAAASRCRMKKIAICLALALTVLAVLTPLSAAQARFDPSVQALAPAAPAPESPCTGVPFAFSYMVTNRNSPWAVTRSTIAPGPAGSLSFYTASGAYRSDAPRLRYLATTQQTFLSRLRSDLNRQPGMRKSLAVFIHGLGNLFDHAIAETAALGCLLSRSQGAA